MRSLTEKHCKSEYNTQHGQVEHNIVSQSNTTPNSTAVHPHPQYVPTPHVMDSEFRLGFLQNRKVDCKLN